MIFWYQRTKERSFGQKNVIVSPGSWGEDKEGNAFFPAF